MKAEDAFVMNDEDRYASMRRGFTRLGILAGLCISSGFVIGAWGLDWVELTAVGAEWPWLRFAAGAVLCLPVGMLAGLLSGRSQSGLVGILVWTVATAIMAFIASHVPFEVSSWVVGKLDPRFAGLDIYPFVPSALTRQWLVIVICIPLGAISGGLSSMALNSLYSSRGFLPKTGMLLVCSAMLALGGLMCDLTNNRPLRTPLSTINIMLDAAVENWGKELSTEQVRSLRLGAVRALGDTVLAPRQVGVGDYEPEALDSMRARINFSGRWVTCYTIADQPTFCQFSDLFYRDFFECLWSRPDSGCKIQESEQARAWLDENRADEIPVVQVVAQRGIYTMMAIETQGGTKAICRFSEYPKLALETCTAYEQVEVKPLPTATPRTSTTGIDQASAPSGDSVQSVVDPGLFEGLGNLPRYSLNLDIQPDGLRYTGDLTLTYTNTTTTALTELLFRMLPNAGQSFGPGKLEASHVEVNGSVVAPEITDDPTVLRIHLPDRLQPEQVVTIGMVFSGQVPLDFGGEGTSAYGIFNFTQRVLSLSGWYPILAVFENGAWRTDAITPIGDAVYSETALYTVDVTTPRHWKVAATGVAAGEQEDENGALRRRFFSGPVRDFYLAASPDFSRLVTEVGGVVINTYALPGSRNGNLAALEIAAGSLEIFNERFGAYPYTELDVVQIPMRNAGGVEFPGIILIEAERYAEPEDAVFITTVSHEVAHQWWYGVVGNDIFNEPWLDEALTTFSSALYWEVDYGPQAYQEVVSYWQNRVQDMRAAGKDDLVTGTLDYFYRKDSRRYGPVVYNKGALFFDALRTEIGDETFFASLQAYYQEFQFKIARGEDLLRIFETTAGRELDDLYQEWLYKPAP